MSGHPDEMDRADAESLATMAQVHLAATHEGAGVRAVADAPCEAGAPLGLSPTPIAGADRARTLLREQNHVGVTRFALAKRVLLRASRLFTYRLVAAGEALADAVDDVAGAQNQAQADLVAGMTRARAEASDEVERLVNSLRAQLVSIEIASQDALDSLASGLLESHQLPRSATASAVSAFESTVSLMSGRMAEIERDRKLDRAEIQRLRAVVSGITSMGVPGDLARSRGAEAGQPKEETVSPPVLDDSTYMQFERRFRGSPQEIKERQLDALRFTESIAGSSAPLLDIGCGRGEWLAVLRDSGVAAYGIDLSSGMVADARALGLDARCEDALTHLLGLPEASLQAVSAFHFAEHVPLEMLTYILDAAFLALRPDGMLLLETPNPTNLVVGSAAFYLDPTHLRQLHPDFLKFLVESRGFIDVEVHFVHPTVEQSMLRGGTPVDGYDPRLTRVVDAAEWALFGPQDYVVVARHGGGTP